MRRMYQGDQSRVTGQLRLSLERTDKEGHREKEREPQHRQAKATARAVAKTEEKGRAGWATPK